MWYVYSRERGCGRGALCRHDVGPETTACRAQFGKIQPCVQIPAMADRHPYGLLESGQGSFIRALSQIRFRARFRQQTLLVTAAGLSKNPTVVQKKIAITARYSDEAGGGSRNFIRF